MTDYVRITDFGAKDALASGNAAKVVKGVDIYAEFGAVATSSATKEDKANKGIASGYAGLNASIGVDITGPSTFGSTVGITGTVTLNSASLALLLSSTDPILTLNETDAAADNRRWLVEANAEQLLFRIQNDALSVTTNFAVIDRTGTTVDNINLLATTVQVNGVDVRSTAIISSGTFADPRIAQTNVTQHQAALSIACSQLTGSMPDARIVASNVTQHQASITVIGNATVNDSAANPFSAGFREIPQNSQSAPYTLVLADNGKHIFHPSADTTARTFTIPANGSVAYPIGTALTFINQNSAGVVTIAITTDTMRLAGTGTTGSRTLAANGVATAVKITSTEWIISGTGVT